VIVVDVGCARYGGDYSIERLIEEFRPDALWGFDPSPEPFAWAASTGAGHYGTYEVVVDECPVYVVGRAAWTFTGEIPFVRGGLGGHVADAEEAGAEMVSCFDLAEFILADLTQPEIVLKIDAEGAEYPLLEHLIAEEADVRLKLVWVEWHGSSNAEENERRAAQRADIEERIRCPIMEWRW